MAFFPPHFFFVKMCLFAYLFVAVLGLHRCWWDVSSCRERGLPSVVMFGPLPVVTSLAAKQGYGSLSSVAVALRLSCSKACGVFLD